MHHLQYLQLLALVLCPTAVSARCYTDANHACTQLYHSAWVEQADVIETRFAAPCHPDRAPPQEVPIVESEGAEPFVDTPWATGSAIDLLPKASTCSVERWAFAVSLSRYWRPIERVEPPWLISMPAGATTTSQSALGSMSSVTAEPLQTSSLSTASATAMNSEKSQSWMSLTDLEAWIDGSQPLALIEAERKVLIASMMTDVAACQSDCNQLLELEEHLRKRLAGFHSQAMKQKANAYHKLASSEYWMCTIDDLEGIRGDQHQWVVMYAGNAFRDLPSIMNGITLDPCHDFKMVMGVQYREREVLDSEVVLVAGVLCIQRLCLWTLGRIACRTEADEIWRIVEQILSRRKMWRCLE